MSTGLEVALQRVGLPTCDASNTLAHAAKAELGVWFGANLVEEALGTVQQCRPIAS